MVAASAPTCPNCGVRKPGRQGVSAGVGCLIIVVALAIISGIISMFDSTSSDLRQEPVQSRAWYSGGTLHRATVADWRAASDRNRLATAADFATTILQPNSVEEIAGPAREMESCITLAVDSAPGTMRVSEIGAVCAVLMGWR